MNEYIDYYITIDEYENKLLYYYQRNIRIIIFEYNKHIYI